MTDINSNVVSFIDQLVKALAFTTKRFVNKPVKIGKAWLSAMALEFDGITSTVFILDNDPYIVIFVQIFIEYPSVNRL